MDLKPEVRNEILKLLEDAMKATQAIQTSLTSMSNNLDRMMIASDHIIDVCSGKYTSESPVGFETNDVEILPEFEIKDTVVEPECEEANEICDFKRSSEKTVSSMDSYFYSVSMEPQLNQTADSPDFTESEIVEKGLVHPQYVFDKMPLRNIYVALKGDYSCPRTMYTQFVVKEENGVNFTLGFDPGILQNTWVYFKFNELVTVAGGSDTAADDTAEDAEVYCLCSCVSEGETHSQLFRRDTEVSWDPGPLVGRNFSREHVNVFLQYSIHDSVQSSLIRLATESPPSIETLKLCDHKQTVSEPLNEITAVFVSRVDKESSEQKYSEASGLFQKNYVSKNCYNQGIIGLIWGTMRIKSYDDFARMDTVMGALRELLQALNKRGHFGGLVNSQQGANASNLTMENESEDFSIAKRSPYNLVTGMIGSRILFQGYKFDMVWVDGIACYTFRWFCAQSGYFIFRQLHSRPFGKYILVFLDIGMSAWGPSISNRNDVGYSLQILRSYSLVINVPRRKGTDLAGRYSTHRIGLDNSGSLFNLTTAARKRVLQDTIAAGMDFSPIPQNLEINVFTLSCFSPIVLQDSIAAGMDFSPMCSSIFLPCGVYLLPYGTYWNYDSKDQLPFNFRMQVGISVVVLSTVGTLNGSVMHASCSISLRSFYTVLVSTNRRFMFLAIDGICVSRLWGLDQLKVEHVHDIRLYIALWVFEIIKYYCTLTAAPGIRDFIKKIAATSIVSALGGQVWHFLTVLYLEGLLENLLYAQRSVCCGCFTIPHTGNRTIYGSADSGFGISDPADLLNGVTFYNGVKMLSTWMVDPVSGYITMFIIKSELPFFSLCQGISVMWEFELDQWNALACLLLNDMLFGYWRAYGYFRASQAFIQKLKKVHFGYNSDLRILFLCNYVECHCSLGFCICSNIFRVLLVSARGMTIINALWMARSNFSRTVQAETFQLWAAKSITAIQLSIGGFYCLVKWFFLYDISYAKLRVDIAAVSYTLSGTLRKRLLEYDKRPNVLISSRYDRVHIFGKLVSVVKMNNSYEHVFDPVGNGYCEIKYMFRAAEVCIWAVLQSEVAETHVFCSDYMNVFDSDVALITMDSLAKIGDPTGFPGANLPGSLRSPLYVLSNKVGKFDRILSCCDWFSGLANDNGSLSMSSTDKLVPITMLFLFYNRASMKRLDIHKRPDASEIYCECVWGQLRDALCIIRYGQVCLSTLLRIFMLLLYELKQGYATSMHVTMAVLQYPCSGLTYRLLASSILFQ